ncbi:MAG TPA: DUF1778 domain-containing protein [Candidatus Obscuribacterales bacterium]
MTTTESQSNAAFRKEAKIERLEARLTKEQKELFQQAADIEGVSLTDFVISHVLEAARRTIKEHSMMVLNERDREAFVEALLNPPTPGDKLQAAAQRYKQFLGTSDATR